MLIPNSQQVQAMRRNEKQKYIKNCMATVKFSESQKTQQDKKSAHCACTYVSATVQA